MMEFTEAQIALITKARKIIHREAIDGGAMQWDRFSDFAGLADFVRVATVSHFLRENIDMTRGGLREVPASLAAAHEAAASITVGEVPDDVVNSFIEKLRAVHEDVQSDENFRAASEMAADLATAIENFAGDPTTPS